MVFMENSLFRVMRKFFLDLPTCRRLLERRSAPTRRARVYLLLESADKRVHTNQSRSLGRSNHLPAAMPRAPALPEAELALVRANAGPLPRHVTLLDLSS